jgi:ribosomal-protein-alanine N-acetyltransferase
MIMHILFETERLFVRRYTDEDFEIFFRMSGDEELMQYIRPAQSREECLEFFTKNNAAYAERPQLGRWALLSKENKETVGSFGVLPLPNTEEIQLGYVLLKEHWGKGYAAEAVQGAIRYCFEKLQLDSIVAVTEVPNTASQKVLLRNGFVYEKSYPEKEIMLNLYRLNKQVD